MKSFISIICSLLICALCTRSAAQSKAPEGIYIIFDASGSMWGKLANGELKIVAAKKALQEFVGKDFSGKEIALRVYGHRREKDCSDSELVIPFGKASQYKHANKKAFQDVVQNINPKGRTPISLSLRQALKDFGKRKGSIILISDGIETCNEDPCALMKAWKDKDIDIKVHVMGFGVDTKTQSALQCIADAAGTTYQDVGSTEELLEGLSDIQENPQRTVLSIKGLDKDGISYKIYGKLVQGQQELFQVESHMNNQVISGSYQLIAGIRTRNGNLYKPDTLRIELPANQETQIIVEVEVPPRVKTTFKEVGIEKIQNKGIVYAYQEGKEVFRFRAIDEVFLDEGTYEFRAQPNKANKMTQTASFEAGDRKDLLFRMVQTVRASFKMYSSKPEIRLRGHVELRQAGEVKYKVHANNGGDVIPGTYEVHLLNDFSPHSIKEVHISDEEEQAFRFIVPCGHVTFLYQKIDGSKDKPARLWVRRSGEKKTFYHNSDRLYAMLPGNYYAIGFSSKGNYDELAFTIAEGENKEVVLRAK